MHSLVPIRRRPDQRHKGQGPDASGFPSLNAERRLTRAAVPFDPLVR